MIERVVEYLANALWQLPLLAVGAWWLLRAARLGPLAQHRVWVAVLGLGVVLPLARVAPRAVVVRPVVMTRVADVDARTMGYMPVRDGGEGSRSSWLRGVLQRRSVEVSAGLARGLAGVYVVLVVLGLVRIGRAWGAARRLVAGAEDVALGEGLGLLLAECGRRVGVGLPRVVESGEVSSPAVVGKVLVLPEGFAGYAEDEMRAALLHELAHLRRRDFGSNLVCEMAGLPVVWHPVSYAVRGRIRSTREMVCDGIAAGAMGSAAVYARSLVGLAARACTGGMEAQPMAVGLFTNNNLEERVMQLMETKQTMMARVSMVRVMSAAAGMAAVLVLAAMVHVTPAMAQQAAAVSQAASAAPDPQTPSPAPSAAPAPMPGLAPVATPMPAPEPALDEANSEEAQSQNEPLAMAHGDKANVEPLDGAFLHEWKGADGQPFKILTRERAEPTPAQKKLYEERFKRQMAEMDKELAELKMDAPDLKREMAEARKRLAEAAAQMNSPELRKQMAELRSPKFKKQMDELKLQMAQSKLDRAETLGQLEGLDALDRKEHLAEQMAQLQQEIAASKLQTAEMQKQLARMRSPEFKKQLEEQIQKQLKEELKAAKEGVDAQVEEQVQRQIEEQRKAGRTFPPLVKSPCTEPCSTQPQ